MRENLKQHKQVFQDLQELIGKFEHLCNEDETQIDLSPFNVDLKLDVTRKSTQIYVSTQSYENLVSTFLKSINISLSSEEFFQERVLIEDKEFICLSNLRDEYSLLDLDRDFTEGHSSSNFLNKRPFFSKQEEEEWNVQMIDSIISNISHTEPAVETKEPTPPKRRRVPKTNELSVRPFVCDFKDCNSAFKRFEHLKRHNRIHTGERPFKCTFPGCYKKFARSDNLAQHIKIHNIKGGSMGNVPFYRNRF